MSRFFSQAMHDVVPDGRHGPGQCWALRFDQVDQRCTVHEPVGHHQVGAGHQGRVRKTPRVGMEHRDDRQHRVTAADVERVGGAGVERMQVARPVAVHHAFRVARGATRVTHCRRGVFLDLRPVELRGSVSQQLLPAQHRRTFQRVHVAVADDDHGAHGLQQRKHRGQQRHQGRVGDHHAVGGLVGDVGDLFRGQPDVECVQHGAHRGHGEVGGEMFGVVPHERADTLVAVDPEAAQRMRQLSGLPAQLPIADGAVAALAAGGGHGPVPVDSARVAQYRGDRQRPVLHRALHGRDAMRSPGSAGGNESNSLNDVCRGR